MIILWFALLITVSNSQFAATPHLADINELPNLAGHDDAAQRGPRWYDYITATESESDMASSSSSESQRSSSSDTKATEDSSDASSYETKERKMLTRVYRVCTPCPSDMMKKYKNIGIKWICAGYQRARRSFKSTCMMRYRNCEDGTMFVKLYNHRCKNDTYHGRHWFYIYRA